MRIPCRNVYREFPELDDFSDDECKRLLERARYVGSYSREVIFVGIFLSMGTITVVPHTHDPADAWLDWLAFGVSCVLCVGSCCIALCLHRWALRRAIADRINAARCRSCNYCLLGLGHKNGSVVCPECGKRFVLADHQLTPSDLLLESQRSAKRKRRGT